MRSSSIVSGLLGALLLVAGCSSPDPTANRDKLRAYLGEQVKMVGFNVRRVDEDNRAVPPTRYAKAAAGVVYTMRHYMDAEDGRVITMITWVYKDAKSMEAAKASGWDELIADIRAGEAKAYGWDAIATPRLSAIVFIDSGNTSLANVFPKLIRDIKAGWRRRSTASQEAAGGAVGYSGS